MIRIIKPDDYAKYYSLESTYGNTPANYYWNEGYTWYQQKPTYCIIAADSVKELDKFLNLDFDNSIKISPKDKIAFNNSDFPSLLLGRLPNIDIKRTTKITQTTKIVTNKCAIDRCETGYNYELFFLDDSLYRIGSVYRDYFKDFDKYIPPKKMEFAKESNHGNILYSVTVSKTIAERAELKLKYHNQLVSDTNLVQYCKAYCPKLEGEDLNYTLSMIQSSDAGIRNTGLSTLQYYNLEDCILSLVKTISDYVPYTDYSKHSAIWEYIKMYIGLDQHDLRNNSRFQRKYYERAILIKLWNNPLLGVKGRMDIKEAIKNRIIETCLDISNVKDNLEMIGCKLQICDTDGKTESGD